MLADGYKDAYRDAGGRVDVAFTGGEIEVAWEPQADQLPASATINEHLQAGRYDEAIPLLRDRLQLEPDHVESLYLAEDAVAGPGGGWGGNRMNRFAVESIDALLTSGSCACHYRPRRPPAPG